jgi:hypothetical protein
MIKSRKLKWVGHVVCLPEIRNTYKVLRIPLVRSWGGFEDNIKMDFENEYMECGDVDWIHLVQDRDQTRSLVSQYTGHFFTS